MNGLNGVDPTGILQNLLAAAQDIEAELESIISERLGLTLAQLQVLRLLRTNGGAQPSQLSDALGCTRGNVTGIINRLQRQGLIRREHSEDDRRVVHLYLTNKGAELAARNAGLGATVSRRTGQLTEAEQEALKRLLERLRSPHPEVRAALDEQASTSEETKDTVAPKGVVVVKKPRQHSIRVAPRSHTLS